MSNSKNKRKKLMRKKNGVQDNLYVYASGIQAAEHLESTQINRFGTRGGTGFAAEDANALNERLRGVHVDKVGRSNEKNGADRIADGMPIQTKYFDSASRTVYAACNADGVYRYPGQQLEVPADQYEQAVSLMKEKIAAGKVPGVSNPEDATTIVKKGSVTYQQAKNIARAGNIDSLSYDVKNNAITSTYAFGIGFLFSFARAKWQGKSSEEAVKESVGMGLYAAGISFIGGLVTSQILRTQAARSGTVLMREGIKYVCKTNMGRLAVSKIAFVSTGKALSGAAATNHVAKLLRSNVITGVVTTVVVTGPDIYRAAISNNTSWAQVGKNLVVNGVGVAAGSAGFYGGTLAGAAAGTAVFPGVGTTIGGLIGGIAGAVSAGAAGSYASKKAMDYLVVDDAKEMLGLASTTLTDLANDYLLTQHEFDEILGTVSKVFTAELLREMYGCDSNARRSALVILRCESYFKVLVNKRQIVVAPAAKSVEEVLDAVVADVESELAKELEPKAYAPNFVFYGKERAIEGKLVFKGLFNKWRTVVAPTVKSKEDVLVPVAADVENELATELEPDACAPNFVFYGKERAIEGALVFKGLFNKWRTVVAPTVKSEEEVLGPVAGDVENELAMELEPDAYAPNFVFYGNGQAFEPKLVLKDSVNKWRTLVAPVSEGEEDVLGDVAADVESELAKELEPDAYAPNFVFYGSRFLWQRA